MSKLAFCPGCGLKHEVQPVKFDMSDELDSFVDDELINTEIDEDGVATITHAHIEAGPYNGERNAIDSDQEYHQCPGCKNDFVTDKYVKE